MRREGEGPDGLKISEEDEREEFGEEGCSGRGVEERREVRGCC